ncbi:TPA: hypothetical protein ACMELR_004462, partial [Klebsiella pneumoniae]
PDKATPADRIKKSRLFILLATSLAKIADIVANISVFVTFSAKSNEAKPMTFGFIMSKCSQDVDED